MKKLVLILLALMMSGCIWGRYPRHGEIEIRDECVRGIGLRPRREDRFRVRTRAGVGVVHGRQSALGGVSKSRAQTGDAARYNTTCDAAVSRNAQLNARIYTASASPLRSQRRRLASRETGLQGPNHGVQRNNPRKISPAARKRTAPTKPGGQPQTKYLVPAFEAPHSNTASNSPDAIPRFFCSSLTATKLHEPVPLENTIEPRASAWRGKGGALRPPRGHFSSTRRRAPGRSRKQGRPRSGGACLEARQEALNLRHSVLDGQSVFRPQVIHC